MSINHKKHIFLLFIMLVIFLNACGAAESADTKVNENINTESSEEKADALRFKEEYEAFNNYKRDDGVVIWPMDIPEKNPFKYVDMAEAAKIAADGEGILFIGAPWCRACRMTALSIIESVKMDELSDNKYAECIYYLDTDKYDNESEGYDEFSEVVLKQLREYIKDADETYTNVYGTPEMIKEKAGLSDEEADNPGKYKYTVSYWKDGKLLGVQVGTSESFQSSDAPPTDKEYEEFGQRFLELANVLKNELCDYC